MTRSMAFALAAGLLVTCASGARAQQDPGARAGSSYIPSTHTAGCGGVLCDGNDPQRAAGAPPPPPCEGLICGVSPYSMQRPVTASEVQRQQEEQARAAAAAPAPAPVETSAKPARKHKAKTKSVKAKAPKEKAVAARTPEPTPPAQPQ